MENPLKGSRVESYNKANEKRDKFTEKKREAQNPLGEASLEPSAGNFGRGIENMVISISTPENWVKIPYYNVRIERATEKLQSIYSKDEKEAHILNNEYNELLEQAAKDGDDLALRKFEKNKLGMEGQ